MYVDILAQLCPWTFALDAVHYSRWLPVFVRTLQDLPEKHPDIHAEFLRGNFSSTKTAKPFSAISDDQLHEHNNKFIKGEGGAIGILDNENALLKWMVSGPRISSLIEEFEKKSFLKDEKDGGAKHHEDNNAFEKRFLTHVKEMINVFTENGNPFEETDLVSIGSSKVIASVEAVKCVIEVFTLGLQQYNEFVVSRLNLVQNSIHEIIPRTNINIFKTIKKKRIRQSLRLLTCVKTLICSVDCMSHLELGMQILMISFLTKTKCTRHLYQKMESSESQPISLILLTAFKQNVTLALMTANLL